MCTGHRHAKVKTAEEITGQNSPSNEEPTALSSRKQKKRARLLRDQANVINVPADSVEVLVDTRQLVGTTLLAQLQPDYEDGIPTGTGDLASDMASEVIAPTLVETAPEPVTAESADLVQPLLTAEPISAANVHTVSDTPAPVVTEVVTIEVHPTSTKDTAAPVISPQQPASPLTPIKLDFPVHWMHPRPKPAVRKTTYEAPRSPSVAIPAAEAVTTSPEQVQAKVRLLITLLHEKEDARTKVLAEQRSLDSNDAREKKNRAHAQQLYRESIETALFQLTKALGIACSQPSQAPQCKTKIVAKLRSLFPDIILPKCLG